MRIIAGRWRGRRIAAPPGTATRPTKDRAREGLFSMLASRIDFEGLAVADLYAGSGAFGLEALSRGAASTAFYEADRSALEALRGNAESLGAEALCSFRGGDVLRAPPPPRPFDLVFADPPYSAGAIPELLDRLVSPGWLAPDAVVAIESANPEIPAVAGLAPLTERRYGKARMFLLRSPAPAP